jgi:hypothetical protein
MYDPDLTLASYLGSVVNVFDNDFRDYWKLDGDGPPNGLSQEAWEGLKFWDTLAMRLLKSARTLQSNIPDENWDLSELIAIADEKGINLKNKFVRDRIELEIAWEIETYLPKMVDNALWLLDHLVAIDNKRTREYLLRVSD